MASRNFLAAQAGVTAVEYALIAGAMGIAAALGANHLGLAVTSNFQLIADSVQPEMSRDGEQSMGLAILAPSGSPSQ